MRLIKLQLNRDSYLRALFLGKETYRLGIKRHTVPSFVPAKIFHPLLATPAFRGIKIQRASDFGTDLFAPRVSESFVISFIFANVLKF